MVPIYHDQDPKVGFGVDSFQPKPLPKLDLQQPAKLTVHGGSAL